jgi:hypothetical protein
MTNTTLPSTTRTLRNGQTVTITVSKTVVHANLRYSIIALLDGQQVSGGGVRAMSAGELAQMLKAGGSADHTHLLGKLPILGSEVKAMQEAIRNLPTVATAADYADDAQVQTAYQTAQASGKAALIRTWTEQVSRERIESSTDILDLCVEPTGRIVLHTRHAY